MHSQILSRKGHLDLVLDQFFLSRISIQKVHTKLIKNEPIKYKNLDWQNVSIFCFFSSIQSCILYQPRVVNNHSRILDEFFQVQISMSENSKYIEWKISLGSMVGGRPSNPSFYPGGDADLLPTRQVSLY